MSIKRTRFQEPVDHHPSVSPPVPSVVPSEDQLVPLELPSPAPEIPVSTMDLLKKNQSPSQRLLANLLNAEKSHLDAVLQSNVLFHNQQAALASYVSAGRDYQLTACVNGAVGALAAEEKRIQIYANTITSSREALKEIRDAEETLASITRDRDILVHRMIKATGKKPSKKSLRNSALHGSTSESNLETSSVYSSSTTRTNNSLAGKLEDAQAELTACEDALRHCEQEVESVRRRVVERVLKERLGAMVEMGRAYERGAERALAELRVGDIEINGHAHLYNDPNSLYSPTGSFEVESNPSIAPSQSASQTGHDDGASVSSSDLGSRRRQILHPPSIPSSPSQKAGGSVAGSLIGIPERSRAAEEAGEGSSDEDLGDVQVVENTPRAPIQRTLSEVGSSASRTAKPVSKLSPKKSTPSLGSRTNTNRTITQSRVNGNDSDSSEEGTLRNKRSFTNPPPTRRKAASDVGFANRPRIPPAPLRRTYSAESNRSVGSSANGRGKRKGFWAGFAGLFKGPNAKSNQQTRERERTTSTWQTRTDSNIYKVNGGASTLPASTRKPTQRRGRRDSSSSDEGINRANLVAVTNVGRGGFAEEKQWKVEPASNGTGPGKLQRSGSSKSTVTQSTNAIKKKTPTAANNNSTVNNNNGTSLSRNSSVSTNLSAPPRATSGNPSSANVSRSNTINSTTSTARSGAPRSGSHSRERQRSTASATSRNGTNQAARSGNSLMNLVEPPVPKMMEIPKAPRSTVTPQMFSITAPPPISHDNSPVTSHVASPVMSPVIAAPTPRPHVPAVPALINGGTHSSSSSTTSQGSSSGYIHVPRPSSTLSPPPRSALRSPPAERVPSPRPPLTRSETVTDGESIYGTAAEDESDLEDDGDLTDKEQGHPLTRRKSVRLDVPPSPGVGSIAESKSNPLFDSTKSKRSADLPAPPPPSAFPSAGWESKIGIKTVDSSDEDEDEGEYAMARRAMLRASRHMESAGKKIAKREAAGEDA